MQEDKIDYLIKFLENKHVPIISKKRHTYLAYHGLDESYVYILKEGIVKISVILLDGREFNLAYIVAPDVISLLKDEVSKYTSSPFNIRIESEEAVFYRMPRTEFWRYVKADQRLQDYVRDYYRKKLSIYIETLQTMTMNGKKGAVCALLCKLVKVFGKKQDNGDILIDFYVTNEDVAGFCGISTRNSVNRIMHDLKQEDIIEISKQKIIIKNLEALEEYTAK